MKINFYEKLSKPSVQKTISLKEWFGLIRNSDYSSQISSSRNRDEEIEALKQTLPCVTYNFLYERYKKDKNIIGSTGIMFIDVDNPSFDIHSLDKNRLLGYYKSVGGRGHHLLLRVEGLTKDNFKESYVQLCENLGLMDYVDHNAIKHSQFSVLSYDCDAFYNNSPEVHQAYNQNVSPSQVISISDNSKLEGIPLGCNIKKSNTYTNEWDTGIRFDNLNEKEIQEGEKYIVDWEGYEYVRCWIPIHKLKDGRKRFLLSYASNLVWLNPSLHYEKFLLILNNVNQVAFETPLPSYRIQNTLNTVIKQLKIGNLSPIYYKYKRKIFFNPKIRFEKGDKQEIVIQELASKKTDDSKTKVKSMLGKWEKEFGVVTARKLFELRDKLGMRISYKTICKYYKCFKEEIKTINGQFQSEQEIDVPELKKAAESLPELPKAFSDIDNRIKTIITDLEATLADGNWHSDERGIAVFKAVKTIASLDNSINPEILYKQILNSRGLDGYFNLAIL